MDYMIYTLSGLQETFLLSLGAEGLVKACHHCISLVGSRLRKQLNCMRVMRQSIAVNAHLQASTAEAIQRLQAYLASCGDYDLIGEDCEGNEATVVFLSRSLARDAKRMASFERAATDRAFWLQDDFRITLYRPLGLVQVESRNSWRKDRLVRKLARAFDLEISRLGFSPSAELNEWREEARNAFISATIGLLWGVQRLEAEGVLSTANIDSVGLLNFCCEYSLTSIIFSGNAPLRTRSIVWRLIVEVTCIWARHLLQSGGGGTQHLAPSGAVKVRDCSAIESH